MYTIQTQVKCVFNRLFCNLSKNVSVFYVVILLHRTNKTVDILFMPADYC